MPHRTVAARALALALLALAAAGISARAQAPPDPKALLAKVRQTYRGLDRMRIEGIVRVELKAAAANQSFESPVRVAIQRPNRIASEMKNAMLGMQYVSDGQSMVIYSEQFNQFMRRPLTSSGDSLFTMTPSAVSRYFTVDEGVKNARWVRDESVSVGGQPVPCAVLEVTYEHPALQGQEFSPTTLWIDRARSVVLRESLMVTGNSPQAGGTMHLAQTTRFEFVDLNATLPDSTFAFQAPAGAQEVTQIGPQQQSTHSDFEGRPAPDFTLTDLAGKPVKLSSLRGKVVLLDFWATWCGPCRIEMPRVQKLHREFRAKGLVVYGVNVGEGAAKVRPFLTKNSYTFPILLDREKSVMEKYGVNGIPTLVIVDRKGTVHSYFVGVREDSVLRNAIADLGIR